MFFEGDKFEARHGKYADSKIVALILRTVNKEQPMLLFLA